MDLISCELVQVAALLLCSISVREPGCSGEIECFHLVSLEVGEGAGAHSSLERLATYGHDSLDILNDKRFETPSIAMRRSAPHIVAR